MTGQRDVHFLIGFELVEFFDQTSSAFTRDLLMETTIWPR